MFPFMSKSFLSRISSISQISPPSIVTQFVPNTHIFQELTYNYFSDSFEITSMVSNDSTSSDTTPAPDREIKTNHTPITAPLQQQL